MLNSLRISSLPPYLATEAFVGFSSNQLYKLVLIVLNSPCCSRVSLPLISSRLKKYVLLETRLILVCREWMGFATHSGAIELHSETSGGGAPSFFESYLCLPMSG